MALQLHPDKNGSHEAFCIMQHAYSVLSDVRKRHIYDINGPDAFDESTGGEAVRGIPPLFRRCSADSVLLCGGADIALHGASEQGRCFAAPASSLACRASCHRRSADIGLKIAS